MPDITVTCNGCQTTYRIGTDAGVVTSEGLGAGSGGYESDPDYVAPCRAGDTPTDRVQGEVQFLLRAKGSGAERYWKCNPCGSVNRYPW